MSSRLRLPAAAAAAAAAHGLPRAALQPRLPWAARLGGAFKSYLPLLTMGLLALATWWLVEHAPGAPSAPGERPERADPDYGMTQFAVERFGVDGRLQLRIEGDRMRHFPATDRIEIDGVAIRAIAPDGRLTLAVAQRAISNGDGSEVQLLGGAQVTSTAGAGAGGPIVMRGEFLHAFLVAERVQTHLPVTVLQQGAEWRAAGLTYDHATRRLDLRGPIRAVFPPGGRATARRQ